MQQLASLLPTLSCHSPLLYVSVDLHQVVLSPSLWKRRKYLSGIVNCLYIPQYHFLPLRYTVQSPLFFREIVDVDRWEEYKMPAGRGGGVIMRHVELNDRHLRSHGKKGNYEQSNFP